jgi:GrpB-like predicted nucleotidyltransferase (UPF0157 family)
VSLALEIVPADPAWHALFASEAARLQRALGPLALRIDHVGSTSVPGLAAKPVIDIQISVAQLDALEPLCRALAPLGYHHLSHPHDAHYPCFHRPAAWPHSHHIHFCTPGSMEERRHLALPSYLRAHPEVARAYAEEKLRLAPRFDAASTGSRNAYADAKGAFLEPVIQRALAEGYPRPT